MDCETHCLTESLTLSKALQKEFKQTSTLLEEMEREDDQITLLLGIQSTVETCFKILFDIAKVLRVNIEDRDINCSLLLWIPRVF